MRRELRHDSKVAARTFALLSPLFTAAFIGMRSVVAPPLVSYFLYSLLFRAQLIPFAWRMPMAASVSLGMVASQVTEALARWARLLQASRDCQPLICALCIGPSPAVCASAAVVL